MDSVFAVQAVMGLVDNITGPLRAVRGGMAQTEAGAGRLSSKMGMLAKTLLPLAVAAGIFLAALAPGVGAAADFESAISGVGAVSGASVSELAALESAALDLGASTAWSAMEVAQAEQKLAMAGYSTQQNIAALPGVLNLASAAQEDLGNTADVASNILSAFKLEASQTGDVADILTAAFTSSNTTLSGLGSTIATVGPVAAAAGASLAEVAAMAGKLGDVGIPAAVAGTGIKIAFQRLQAPAGAAANQLKDLGIATKDSVGNMLPIFDILKNLETQTAAMGSADRAGVLKKIFGEEAIGSVTALMGTGIDNIREYAGVLGHSTGKAAAVATMQLDNFKGAVVMFGSAWEGLKISIGKIFLPVLTPLIQGITTVVGWLNRLAQTPVGKAVIGVSAAIAVAVIAVTAFAGASALVAMALPFIAGTLAAVGAAFVAISWPVWAIVAAIGVLYVAWRKNFGGIADIMAAWWNKISLVFQGVKAVFSSLNGTTGMIEGELSKNIKAAGLVGLVTTVGKVVYRIKMFFAGMWDALKFSILGIADIFRPVFASIMSAVTPLWDILKAVGSVIAQVGAALWGVSASTDVSSWRTFGEVVGIIVGGSIQMLAWAIRLVITPLKWLFDIIGFLLSAFVSLGEGIGTAAGWIVVSLEALPAMFGRIADGMSNAFSMVFGWITGKITGLSNFFSGIDWSGQGTKLMGTLVTGIKWAFMNLTPVGWLIQAFSGVKSFLDGIDLSACGAKLMGTLAAGIKSTLNLPMDLVKTGLSKIRNLLPFSDAKEGPLSALTSSGQAIMNTLATGVKQSVPSLVDAVKGGAAVAAASLILAAPPATASQGMALPTVPELSASMAVPELNTLEPVSLPITTQTPLLDSLAVPTVTPEIKTPDTLGIEFNVAPPVMPALDPLVTSMAVNEAELPTVPELSASMAVPEPGENIPGLNDRTSPVPAMENRTMTTKNSKKQVVISIGNITLPGVSDGPGFVKDLQQFLEEYDV
jgi:TP901 family phage tail tape measure protein